MYTLPYRRKYNKFCVISTWPLLLCLDRYFIYIPVTILISQYLVSYHICVFPGWPQNAPMIRPVHVIRIIHDDVIKWKHFPRYWPFVRGIHRSPVNSPRKGQWRGALMLSLIWAWINCWANNREVGDLRHHRAHYDVTVMLLFAISEVGVAAAQCMPRLLGLNKPSSGYLTHWGRDKSSPFRRRYFQVHFLEWKVLNFK